MFEPRQEKVQPEFTNVTQNIHYENRITKSDYISQPPKNCLVHK